MTNVIVIDEVADPGFSPEVWEKLEAITRRHRASSAHCYQCGLLWALHGRKCPSDRVADVTFTRQQPPEPCTWTLRGGGPDVHGEWSERPSNRGLTMPSPDVIADIAGMAKARGLAFWCSREVLDACGVTGYPEPNPSVGAVNLGAPVVYE